MGWVDGVNKNSGDVISAALWTSYLGAGDGIDAMETAKVTTAGDIVYATGDNALSRLGIGSARQVLQMNAGVSAPEYAASAQSVMTAKGDILAASGANTMTRLAVGSDGQVLTAASGQASGLSWAAAPGATTAADNEMLSFPASGQARVLSITQPVVNRLYISVLTAVRRTITVTEFITPAIGGSGNYILSIFSFDNTNLTSRASTGSTSVPSSADNLTKLALSFEMVVGQRYAMGISFSDDPDVGLSTLSASSTQIKNMYGYNDVGSFSHPSTLAWSAVTNSPTLALAPGVWNNGGLIT